MGSLQDERAEEKAFEREKVRLLSCTPFQCRDLTDFLPFHRHEANEETRLVVLEVSAVYPIAFATLFRILSPFHEQTLERTVRFNRRLSGGGPRSVRAKASPDSVLLVLLLHPLQYTILRDCRSNVGGAAPPS